MMSTPQAPRRSQRGLSLIEAMMVLTVVSIAIGSALPSLATLRQRADLAGVAAQVETDVQFAKSQAVSSNRTVQLTLRESAEGTCYMVHTGPAANCTCSGGANVPASCTGDAELLRAVSFVPQGPVQVRSASKSLTFDPFKGTVTPTATLRVEGKDGRAVHQVVNLLGRVRSCSPNGRVVDERSC
jgi:type IV fimbrial biogenesis protein FimT